MNHFSKIISCLILTAFLIGQCGLAAIADVERHSLAPKSQVKGVHKALEESDGRMEIKDMLDEEIEAQEFVLSNKELSKWIESPDYKYLTRKFGYLPWKQLYEAAGNGHSREIFFESGLPLAIYSVLKGKDITLYWPVIVELAMAAGKNIHFLFEKGLPAVASLIKNKDDLNKYGKDLLKIFQVCAGTEFQTADAIYSLKPLIKEHPKSWNKFIMPIVFNQTVGAFLCFKEVMELYSKGAIAFWSDDDLAFIKEIIEKNGVRAYDILMNFLVKGIDRHVIFGRISGEKDLINKYFETCPYPIIEIYKAYKESSPETRAALVERCKKIHRKIIEGDAWEVDQDPFFGEMLMYVFPPAVTTERNLYLNLYDWRSDRLTDTAGIPLELQGKRIEVNAGNYILKDPSKPLDETPWHLILNVIQEVNKEGKIIISDTDLENLGRDLMESWNSGRLRERREEMIKGLYRYYHHAKGQTLPASLGTVQNIMALKQYTGDTMRDLAGECINKYAEKEPEKYATIMDKMFKTKIENPKGMARGILKVLNDEKLKDRAENVRATIQREAIGKMLKIEDKDVLEKIWEKVRGETEPAAIERMLEGITFSVQGGKEAVAIAQTLQGEEFKAMQGEVSAKYEFRESVEKIKLRCVVSKRKTHGVAGCNMGVCVAPDEKLWNNPNFMNVILFDQNDIAQGGMHVLLIEDGGKKYLTLPGINPSVGLMAQVAAADIYDKLIAYAHELAGALGCDGVLIPTDASIHSNRSEIQRVVTAKCSEKVTLSKIHQFSYSPEYSFQECYIVPPLKKALAPNTDDAVQAAGELGEAA